MALLQGYYLRDMQISTLVAAFLNANRDPKKGRAIDIEQLSVFQPIKRPRQEQSAQRQRELLEAITLALGGEVVSDD